MTNLHGLASLAGRALLSAIFVLSGAGKIFGYAGTAAYMESQGVPGILLPAVIAVELLGGLMILVGFGSRWAALALAGFTLAAAALFHNNLADQTQMIMFMKNLAIAGGLLLLFANGPGRLSLKDD